MREDPSSWRALSAGSDLQILEIVGIDPLASIYRDRRADSAKLQLDVLQHQLSGDQIVHVVGIELDDRLVELLRQRLAIVALGLRKIGPRPLSSGES